MINRIIFSMEQTDQNIELKKISVARNALNYGVILGIALVVLSLIFYILDFNNTNIVFWIQFVILLAGLVISTMNYRKNIGGGFITYGKSLGSGVLTGLFAAIILGIYIYIFFKFIDTGAIQEIISKAEDKIIDQNPEISDAQLETIMTMQRKFMTPLWMGIMSLIYYTFYSFIASLIISIFTRKTDKSFETNFR